MAYTQQKGIQNKATAIAGVAAIHGAIGIVLITGLSAVVFDIPDDKPLTGSNITVPLPPPPPTPAADPKPDDIPVQSTAPDIYTPPVPLDINSGEVEVTTSTTMPQDYDFTIKTPLPTGNVSIGNPTGGIVQPKSKPVLADPIAAKPRNDPGSWITTSDYRSAWINREWTGTARFSVTIDTSGRVQDCRITKSTGHTALDNATCSLITRRARFEPARNGARDKVAGTYASAIVWELPR